MSLVSCDMSDQILLHSLVWDNALAELGKALAPDVIPHNQEAREPHGRTALMLVVSLGRVDAAKLLIMVGANVNTECDGWSVQEATSTGDHDLVQLVLDTRDRQRYSARLGGIPELPKKLKDNPDFYVEMTWEFTSWVPLVSRMCPSDTYRVYKRGSSVRVDTTLLGFDQNTWVRGSRSYIFTGTEEGTAQFTEIVNYTKQIYIEEMGSDPDLGSLKFSTKDQVQHRMASPLIPLIQTFFDTENISFQRLRSGLFGFGGDKSVRWIARCSPPTTWKSSPRPGPSTCSPRTRSEPRPTRIPCCHSLGTGRRTLSWAPIPHPVTSLPLPLHCPRANIGFRIGIGSRRTGLGTRA